MTATTTSTSTTSSTTLSPSSTNTFYEDSATSASSAKKAKAKPRHSVRLGCVDKKSNPKPKAKANNKHYEKYYETEIPLMNYNPSTGKSVIWGYQSVFRADDDAYTDEQNLAANTVCEYYPTGQPREYTFIITTPETFLESEDGKV